MIDITDISFSSSSIDDVFMPQKTATRLRVADSSVAALQVAAGKDPLIHIAQNDFWKLGHDSEGFYVERLVEDDQGPVGG